MQISKTVTVRNCFGFDTKPFDIYNNHHLFLYFGTFTHGPDCLLLVSSLRTTQRLDAQYTNIKFLFFIVVSIAAELKNMQK